MRSRSSEIVVAHQLDPSLTEQLRQGGVEKCRKLGIPFVAPAVVFRKLGSRRSRVTVELGDAGRNNGQSPLQALPVQSPSITEPYGPVGCAKPVFSKLPLSAAARQIERRNCRRPIRLRDSARSHVADIVFRGQTLDDSEQAGKKMNVLVAVQVRGLDSRVERMLDLVAKLGLDLAETDPSQDERAEQTLVIRRESAPAVDERRKLRLREQGLFLNQREVDSHREPWVLGSYRHRVLERSTAGNERA